MRKVQTKSGFSIEIIFEDDDVLVINKPAGLVVHPKTPNDDEDSIQSVFSNHLSGGEVGREGIVHRLDRETSGVMILAKNKSSLEFLQSQFANREVTKEYITLVWGHPKYNEARLELPIRRSRKSPAKMEIHSSGKESVSEYQVLERYNDYSLISISLHTGRTHQIRVQFAHTGHPVVGDRLYGKRIIPNGLVRQFLHAQKLCLKLPQHTKTSCFEAELPNDLQLFLESLDA